MTGFLLFLLIFLLGAESVFGQYFGRNKVNYYEPDFVVRNTPNFAIHHYNDNEAFMDDAAYITERWYERLTKIFDMELPSDQPVVYYRNQLDFQSTFIIGGFIGQGTRGFTDAFQQRLVMPYTGNYSGFDHIVGHEMVHVFQYRAALSYGQSGLQNMNRLPLWFIEGKAEYLSIGKKDPHTSMYLRDALLRDDLPSIRDLSRRQHEFFPYRFGHAFWNYVGAEYGDDVISPLYHRALEGGLAEGFRRVLNTDRETFSENWKEAIREDYGPAIAEKDTPGQRGREILSPDKHAGSMNLAPSVSPDGNQVVFFSEKDLFSTELFLADARTGELEDRLTSSATNRHFETLNFMESGGSWSPDGRRVAFTVTEDGRHKIVVVNANDQSVERKIDFGMDRVDEISNPSWSPDGESLVFSGLKDGWTNLYTVNVRSEELAQLTEGRHADINPVWSPDGDKILFSSDRHPDTDFDRLQYGPYQLAFYHIEEEEIEVLDVFDEGKHINPQFGPEGENIYFISDQDGFSDVYRKALNSEDIYRVTEYATGVSGITENAPAMSVASESGEVMYSVFNDSEYIIYRLEGEEALGEPYEEDDTKESVAGIPPIGIERSRDIVTEYLEEPELAMDIGTDHPTHDYEPSLMLNFLGQGGIGVGIGGPGGSGVGGQITAQWGDVLGDHQLTGAAFMQGQSIQDLGGQAYYQNFENRWQWGVLAGRIPFTISRFFEGEADNINFIEERLRQTMLDGDFILQYPFSQTLRFETGVGYSQYRFTRDIIRYHTNGDRDRESQQARSPLHFFNTNFYLVGDNSHFGFTSPLHGWRYRIGFTPTTGSLDYVDSRADLRYYEFFNPITFAVRGLYEGRYGGDRDNDDLRSRNLRNTYYMRGYASFDPDIECSGSTIENCRRLERLRGSQLGLINLETRIPLLGTDQLGLINFPYLPTELVGFFDAGVTWNSEQSPVFGLDKISDGETATMFDFDSEERTPVMSAGISARFNLLGALVLEPYYAWPLHRRESGGQFGLSLFPGW